MFVHKWLLMVAVVLSSLGAAVGTAAPPVQEQVFPVPQPVKKFVFSDHHQQVYCLAGDGGFRGEERIRLLICDARGKAAARWLRPVDDPAAVHDVAVSADGKTVWVAITSDEEEALDGLVMNAAGKWQPLLAGIPIEDQALPLVKKVYPAPDDAELWLLTSSSGVLRVDPVTREITHHLRAADAYRSPDNRPFGPSVLPIISDYGQLLAFSPDGTMAAVYTRGGNKCGITLIDRKTVALSQFQLDEYLEHFAWSPDGKQLWCVLSTEVRVLDVAARKWEPKVRRPEPDEALREKFIFQDHAQFTKDGKFAWISGIMEASVCEVGTNQWKRFHFTEGWSTLRHGLVFSQDGKTVLTGHDRGAALLSADGRRTDVLQVEPAARDCQMRAAVALPEGNDMLCALRSKDRPEIDGIYRVNTAERRLTLLRRIGAEKVYAMSLHNNVLWVGTNKSVIRMELDKEQGR